MLHPEVDPEFDDLDPRDLPKVVADYACLPVPIHELSHSLRSAHGCPAFSIGSATRRRMVLAIQQYGGTPCRTD